MSAQDFDAVAKKVLDDIRARVRSKSEKEVLEESINFVPKYQCPVEGGPCLIIHRLVQEIAIPANVYNLEFQIFHTDFKRLSSRKHLVPVDGDTRRPIFRTSSLDGDVWLKYLTKNAHLFLAFTNLSSEIIDGKQVTMIQQGARDQAMLYKYVAWSAHVWKHRYGVEIEPPHWCAATVNVIDNDSPADNAAVSAPDRELSVGDFNAVLRNEKTLLDCGIDITRAVGMELPPEIATPAANDRFARQKYEKEVLEDAELITKH